MAEIDEALVEAVSRAMVKAVGRDPEEVIGYEDGVYLCSGPRWKAERDDALKQIAAFETITAHRLALAIASI